MSTVYEVKSNEELFNQLKSLDQKLAGIVQNDQILTEEQVKEWRDYYTTQLRYFHQEYMKKINEFTSLMQKTILYLESCKKHD